MLIVFDLPRIPEMIIIIVPNHVHGKIFHMNLASRATTASVDHVTSTFCYSS